MCWTTYRMYQQGADVQRLHHYLSVYPGHVHITHTQVYPTMTADLLQQAGLRFEQYARGDAPSLPGTSGWPRSTLWAGS
jgi:hypothetical protein